MRPLRARLKHIVAASFIIAGLIASTAATGASSGTDPIYVALPSGAELYTVRPGARDGGCNLFPAYQQNAPPGTGPSQFTIEVPPTATRLVIKLEADQPDELFVKFGQPVEFSGPQPNADFSATAAGAARAFTIDSTSSPALSTGIYYIAWANCSPNQSEAKLTATVSTGSAGPPKIISTSFAINGDTLKITVTAAAPLRIVQRYAGITDENGSGPLLGSSFQPTPVDFPPSPSFTFDVSFSGLSKDPTAAQYWVNLVDEDGNRDLTQGEPVDFRMGDGGGPSISRASLADTGGKITIKGQGLAGATQIQINGATVTPQSIRSNGDGTKARVFIAPADLDGNLLSGANRIRVSSNGLWSNLSVVMH